MRAEAGFCAVRLADRLQREHSLVYLPLSGTGSPLNDQKF
jgi:hypothetical protein